MVWSNRAVTAIELVASEEVTSVVAGPREARHRLLGLGELHKIQGVSPLPVQGPV